MNGTKYLLDTNYILAILKSNPQVLEEIKIRQIIVSDCAYSAITRMELLGFPGITVAEESTIRQKLMCLTYLPLSLEIENKTIQIRQSRRIKLPDAIIAATALELGLELLTLDKQLLSVVLSSQ